MGVARRDKSRFSNLTVCKKSGGDLASERPLFCENGKSLLVTCGQSCHMYNTSTGDHVRELFTCDNKIISCQLHPRQPSVIIAATEKGELISYNLETNQIQSNLTLTLNPSILNRHRVPKFNQEKLYTCGDYEKNVDWQNELSSLKNVKFFHVLVKPSGNSAILFVWASWSLKDESQCHISTFSYKKGEHTSNVRFPQVALKQCNQNFILGQENASDILVTMASNFVFVAKISNDEVQNKSAKHMIGYNIELTCLAFNSAECSFATGDSIGRVIIWRSIFEKHPLKDIRHWHTLPVHTLTFSDYGSLLYSGGEENVLVKWSLSTRRQDFLPRLSSVIHHISIAPEGSLLSVSTTDNRILIITSIFESVSTIQHFSKWSVLGARNSLSIFTTDPKTEAFVLNGRTGHLQFLSSRENGRLLYTFDVTNRNYICRERNRLLSNTDVTHAKFSTNGKWMVTAESREDDLSSESRLKFWEYDDVKQEFTLNTDIELPHDDHGIYSMEISCDDVVATTGRDKKFKLWSLFESHGVNKVKQIWSLLKAGTYRLLECYAVDFSQDGSLIAVSYGPILTIWETNTCELKCSLTPPLKRDKLNFIKFGRKEFCHIVVSATDVSLSAWNVITLSMIWTVELKASVLVSDPYSAYMCAFSSKNNLFIFNPSSPSPAFKLENVSESSVLSANFSINIDKDADRSQLYFVNADQELFCLENAESAKSSSMSTEAAKYFTPFAAQVAERTAGDVRKGGKVRHILSKLGSEYASSILDSPAHTLPNPSLLCSDVLRSMLFSTKSNIPSSSTATKYYEDDDITEINHSEPTVKNAPENFVDETELLSAFNVLFT